jgi:lipopolysaccharide export system permease protein
MVLLAATVSLMPPRQRGTFALIALGVFIGLIVFFMSNFLQALGTSHQIPVPLAAWSPAIICLLLGASVVMTLEDG